MNERYTCKNCGYELKKDEIPCPKCGCEGRAISVELFDKIGVSDSLKLHSKSGEKREDGKPKKEIVSKIKNGNERRIIRDRRNENTQATFTVWRDGKLHHIHDKTSNRIEIWQKEGNTYWDKDGNLYSRITSKKDNLTEVFVDSDGKEYTIIYHKSNKWVKQSPVDPIATPSGLHIQIEGIYHHFDIYNENRDTIDKFNFDGYDSTPSFYVSSATTKLKIDADNPEELNIYPIPLSEEITELNAVSSGSYVNVEASAKGWIILVKKEDVEFEEIK